MRVIMDSRKEILTNRTGKEVNGLIILEVNNITIDEDLRSIVFVDIERDGSSSLYSFDLPEIEDDYCRELHGNLLVSDAFEKGLLDLRGYQYRVFDYTNSTEEEE